MKKTTALLLSAVLLTLFAHPVQAATDQNEAAEAMKPERHFGGSNFASGDYPDHSCVQPPMPVFLDQGSVATFQTQLAIYKQCILDYLDASANDQNRIKEKADEAAEEYNSFAKKVNRR